MVATLNETEEVRIIEDRVGIIGGGTSGLLCKKWLRDMQIESDIYESKESLFGVWDKKEGFTWEGMKTNLSQHMCQFSDHFWDIQQPYLPTNVEVRDYLHTYVEKCKLDDNIYFRTQVKRLYQESKTELYVLEILDLNSGKEYIRKYKKVLIASGLYNGYEIPAYQGFEKFKGDYIHSSLYKRPTGYEQKNVLIVGMSLSSGNISDQIAEISEKKIFMSCRTPAYIQQNEVVDPVTKRSSTMDSRQIIRPIDDVLNLYGTLGRVYELSWAAAKDSMSKYQDLEYLHIKYGQSLRISFSSTLVNHFRQEKVVLTKDIKEFHDDNIVEFKDGRKEKIDSIIFCTGYKNRLDYIDEKILIDIQYDADNDLIPITAYLGVYQKNHKNLLFVGMQRGLFWSGQEMQARYVTGLIGGKYSYPNEETYEDIIKKETDQKNSEIMNKIKLGYSYIAYLDNVAREMGVFPDFKKIKSDDIELYQALMSVTPTTVSYRINKEDPLAEINIDYLKKMAKEFQNNI